jgi:hypothetical protein
VRFSFHPRHAEKIGQSIEPCGAGEPSQLPCHVGDIFRYAGRVLDRLARLGKGVRQRRAPDRPGPGLSRFGRAQGESQKGELRGYTLISCNTRLTVRQPWVGRHAEFRIHCRRCFVPTWAAQRHRRMQFEEGLLCSMRFEQPISRQSQERGYRLVQDKVMQQGSRLAKST